MCILVSISNDFTPRKHIELGDKYAIDDNA